MTDARWHQRTAVFASTAIALLAIVFGSKMLAAEMSAVSL